MNGIDIYEVSKGLREIGTHILTLTKYRRGLCISDTVHAQLVSCPVVLCALRDDLVAYVDANDVTRETRIREEIDGLFEMLTELASCICCLPGADLPKTKTGLLKALKLS